MGDDISICEFVIIYNLFVGFPLDEKDKRKKKNRRRWEISLMSKQ